MNIMNNERGVFFLLKMESRYSIHVIAPTNAYDQYKYVNTSICVRAGGGGGGGGGCSPLEYFK